MMHRGFRQRFGGEWAHGTFLLCDSLKLENFHISRPLGMAYFRAEWGLGVKTFVFEKEVND